MTGNARVVLGIPLLSALLLTACRTDEPVSPIGTARPAVLSRSVAPSGAFRTFDDELLAIAEKAPGFAGVVGGNDGAIEILTIPRAHREAVRETVAAFAASHGMSAVRDVVWREVRYDFATLYRVRQAVRALRVPGLRFVDLDEANNQVFIGVASVKDSIEASSLVKTGVASSSAVTIQVVSPIKPASLLTDFMRPLVAGLQITMEDGGTCTAGPIARPSSGNTRYMVVNSHCTSTPFSYDGGIAHQPFVWNPWGTRVGVEYADHGPYYEPDGCGYTYEYCRNADAALVSLDSVAPYKIARTTWVSITPGSPGSLTLANDGNFTVTGVVPYSNLIVNQGLHKVGRTTGWTAGAITRSCVDVVVVTSPNDFVLLCQFFASGAVGGGDSGSPVFQWYGSAPDYDSYVAGTLWGAASDSEFVFSPWAAITADFFLIYPHP